MPSLNNKIAVLDFGGQYAHLITSRLRNLGALSEIVNPQNFTSKQAEENFKGLVFSGGPSSVYKTSKPQFKSDPNLLKTNLPILGICYGHQLLIQQSGGVVIPAKKAEYGPAILNIKQKIEIFKKLESKTSFQVWMSHGDEVETLAPNFSILGETKDCPFAAVANLERKHFGLQFHPEVQGTEFGQEILSSFIELCGLKDSWSIQNYLEEEKKRIQTQYKNSKIFFLLSGGVDSTVAFALVAHALTTPSDEVASSHPNISNIESNDSNKSITKIKSIQNLKALHIDTGFMRDGESELVCKAMKNLGVEVELNDASNEFFRALKGITKPEEKRVIIGELFLSIQQEASKNLKLDVLKEEWILGQGTIYPDHVESGANHVAEKIKTHHNRVSGIQALIAEGRVIEPLAFLYKDEVRSLGNLLNLPQELVDRHPFPGPGLAVRCLCTQEKSKMLSEEIEFIRIKDTLKKDLYNELQKYDTFNFDILPIQSVGVQGDKRSYKHCLALTSKTPVFSNWNTLKSISSHITNQFKELNRVILNLDTLESTSKPKNLYLKYNAYLTPDRISILRRADKIVHDFLIEKNYYKMIWQAPVVLLPLSSSLDNNKTSEEALVLRPICSSDAMTAEVFEMPFTDLMELNSRLKKIKEIISVFYDLTSKPPGTIEWE